MLQQIALVSQPVLEWSLIRRVRRNHGLEHATIHMLSRRLRGLRVAGRSSDSGFALFGDVVTEHVEEAVNEALRRMQNGEHNLALHPNCGTNLVTAGALTSLVALIGLSGSSLRSKFDRLPLVMMLMMFAILVSQPLGMALQEHFTTKGEPGDLEVVSVTRREVRMPFSSAPVTVHNIITRGG